MEKKLMSESEIRKFKALMIRSGFVSVVKLAEAMGLRREKLSRKINGRDDWSKSEMEIVGKLFNEDPKDIFFGEKVRETHY